jgi:MFS family permease
VVLVKYPWQLVLGTLGATCTFVVFYLMTVFALGWATRSLGFDRQQFLILQMLGVLFFGLTIPLSAIIADRIGQRSMLMIAQVLMIAFGFAFEPLFGAHLTLKVFVFLALGFALSGLTYGPLGSALATLFPTAVRYTGTSLSFNLSGILGASLAPSIATSLALHYGVAYVGYYLSGAGFISLAALFLIKAGKGAGTGPQ